MPVFKTTAFGDSYMENTRKEQRNVNVAKAIDSLLNVALLKEPTLETYQLSTIDIVKEHMRLKEYRFADEHEERRTIRSLLKVFASAFCLFPVEHRERKRNFEYFCNMEVLIINPRNYYQWRKVAKLMPPIPTALALEYVRSR